MTTPSIEHITLKCTSNIQKDEKRDNEVKSNIEQLGTVTLSSLQQREL